jgi:hypothetical protein
MATKRKPAEEVKKGPRPQSLPGMEDGKVEVLEDKALEYAEVRDQRISLSQQEGELKAELLGLMKAQKREHYVHENVEIHIVHEKENVKVKVKSAGSDDEESEDEEDSE